MQAPSDLSRENIRTRFSDLADVTALLAAFCFFLSAIEYMLPKPMPFMRLGIANLPILLAVDLLPFKWFLVLAAAKVVGMSIVSGTLFSYVALFSLAGTLVAALVMRGVRRVGKKAVSLIGVSMAGAVTSNAVQMIIARYVIFGEAAWLIAPLFLATGLITGALMGLFSEYFIEHSSWYACAIGASDTIDSEIDAEQEAFDAGADHKKSRKSHKKQPSQKRLARRQWYEDMFDPRIQALLGVGIAVFFLLQREIVPKALYLLLFIVWTWVAGKRFSLVSTVVVTLGIVIANLFIPSGHVLFKLGPLTITEVALKEGFSKALTFEGLMYLSKATIMPGLHFPGRFGGIIAKAFQYYDRVIEYRGKVHAKTIVRDVDALLQKVWLGARLEEEVGAHGSETETQETAMLAPAVRLQQSVLLVAMVLIAIFCVLIVVKVTGF